jgi:hypothetical protein
MSTGPFGGPPGVQFPAVFQSPLPGVESHAAEPAKAEAKQSVSPSAPMENRIQVFKNLPLLFQYAGMGNCGGILARLALLEQF